MGLEFADSRYDRKACESVRRIINFFVILIPRVDTLTANLILCVMNLTFFGDLFVGNVVDTDGGVPSFLTSNFIISGQEMENPLSIRRIALLKRRCHQAENTYSNVG